MRYFFILPLLLVATATVGYAQSNTFPSDGNVGIGTVSPLSNIYNTGLHISKGSHSTLLLGDPVDRGYGGIIQTSDNRHRIFIGANLYDDQTNSWGSFESGEGAAGISIIANQSDWGAIIQFLTSGQDGQYRRRMTIKGNGNIGIGTTEPKTKLAVKGIVKTKEIVVSDQSADWPDYIFAKNYNLPELKEVETFIKVHKHLPDVPSRKEIIREGQRVGDIQAKLLKKIEELTLYAIEQQKVIQEQQKTIDNRRHIEQKLKKDLLQRIKKLEQRLQSPPSKGVQGDDE